MTAMTAHRDLLSNFNWVMAANLVSGASNFLAMAWFARQLGPSILGDYAVVVTTLQLVAAILSAGFDQAVIREPDNKDLWAAATMATVSQAFVLIVASGCVYFVYHLQSPTVATGLLYPAGLVLSSIVVSLFSYLIAAPIAAMHGYRYLSVVRLASMLAGVGSGLTLASLDAAIYALAARDLVCAAAMLLLVWIRSPAHATWNASRPGLTHLMRFARGMWGLNILERLALRLDYMLVAILLGKELLGMYFVVRGLVEGLLGFLVNPIQTVLYAHYCRMRHEAQLHWGSDGRISAVYWGACILLAVLSYFFAPYTISMLLGEPYRTAYVIMPGLVVYCGGILLYETLKVMAMSQSRHSKLIMARISQIVVVSITIYPLTQSFGLFGASLATAAGATALAAVAWIRTMRLRSAQPLPTF